MRKRIVFTGGNTAGHVIPNIPIIQKFRSMNWKIYYFGSDKGIEAKIVPKLNVEFFGVQSGKLRRYLDLRNLLDVPKVVFGIINNIFLLKRINPNIIFSKGGFVSLPVVTAAWLLGIPIIAHESDLTLSLTSKLSLLFCKKLCCGFAETLTIYDNKKLVYTGIPVRETIGKQYSLSRGQKRHDRLLVLGGSLGSQRINSILRSSLPLLINKFEIFHVCGNDIDMSLSNLKNYKQFSFIDKDFLKLLVSVDIVVCRSGATTLHELLLYKKPSVLIPLSLAASRGDQLANALYFKKRGFADIIFENDLSSDNFAKHVINTFKNKNKYISKMADVQLPDSVELIERLIINYSS